VKTTLATRAKRATCASATLLLTAILACNGGAGPVGDGVVPDGDATPTDPTGDTGGTTPGGDGEGTRPPGTTGGDAGVETPATCTECPKGCFDLQTDVTSCGSCGYKCPIPAGPAGAGTLATCTAGKCGEGCSAGTTYCNGTCVDTKSDARNCGACGAACARPTGGTTSCALGTCKPTCGAGKALCGSACVTTDTDPKHCGACGKACPAAAGEAATCTAGVCGTQCLPGFTLCNGKCVDLQNDRNSCGTCGKACAADSTYTKNLCSSGRCYESCQGGYARCAPFSGESSTCCPPTSRCCYGVPPGGGKGYAYCGSSTSC
jgi:hypothetical protein